MSLKGISDLQQKMIAEIMLPYMEIDTNLKKKSIILSKETSEIIEKGKSTLQFATKNNLQLPKSTYNVVRYGPAIEKIFDEIEKYAKYERVKKRIKRVVQYAHVIVWDKRAIENVLKKSEKPKIKSQDDIKILRQFLNEFTGFKDTKSEEIFNKYSKLYIAKNTISEHFSKADHYLKDYKEKKTKLDQLIPEQNSLLAQKEEILTSIDKIKKKENQNTEKFYSKHHTGVNIASKRKDLSNLVNHPPLSNHLKILGELVDTFESYLSKQEIDLGFEVQGALHALKDNLVSSSSSIDQSFPELVEQFKKYGDRAYGKKRFYIKFLQEIGGVDNFQSSLLSGPGYNAWYDARQIQKDIEVLEKTGDYETFIEGIAVLGTEIKKKNKELSSLEEKIKKVNQDIKDVETLLETCRTHLDNWLKEIHTFA